MNNAFGFLQRCGALIATALVTLTSLQAQSFNLTFDASQLNNPDYNNSNLWVTFSGAALDATFSGSSVLLTSGTTGAGNAMTQSFALSDIVSAGGFTINSATSVSAYISYGSNVGFDLAANTPSPVTTSTRFTNFEFSYNPAGAAQADMTAINLFGGGLRLDTYTDVAMTQVQSSRYLNVNNSAEVFRALSTVAGYTPSTPSAGVITGTQQNGPNAGATIWNRVIAPNTFSGPGSVPFVTPTYPSMNSYLGNLAAASSGTTSIASLGLIAPGADPTLSPAQGYVYTTGGKNYNYDLHYDFDATVSVTSGTYTVVMTGSVTAALTSGQPPDGNNPVTITYNGLSVSITLPDEAAVNTWIYQQANPPGNLPTTPTLGAGTISYVTNGWATLNGDFGPAAQNFYLRIPNDFTQGMLTGMVGSDVPSGIGGLTIGQLNSAQWWANPDLAFHTAQPADDFYNTFSDYLWYNSGGLNPGESAFTDGGIYTNPFDDRFGTADLDLFGVYASQPQDATLAMKVSLIPDGDLNVNTVPEPGTWALVSIGLAVLFRAKRRRVEA